MALPPGTRIGPHEITAQIGVGGMGEVYRAIDTNLKRQVAIKVLPPDVSQSPERLARFRREAEVLASMSHPNIAAIFGLEQADGQTALVMEIVEGPTLADRIAHGAIPADEVITIAKQISEALEAAHEQGIVHRDLKPANIKLRTDGTVKVLDFGLAKAIAPALTASSGSSLSPTISTPAMTQAGVILGTAAYMSPEQARGQSVDRRADIWAFGCLLYEMLTGRRPFDGGSVAETLASVMKSDPEWNALPGDMPQALRDLIPRCLVKDPRQRIRDMGDVRLALERGFDLNDGVPSHVAPRAVSVWQRLAPWVGGLVAGAAIAIAAAWAWTTARPAAPRVQRFHLAPDSAAPLLVSTSYTDLAMAPDGRSVAYSAAGATRTLRRLSLIDGQETVLVTGGDPFEPFFSPDGASIGFYDLPSQELRRVSSNGGAVQTIGRVGPQVRGASWGPDGTVVYSHATTPGLWRMAVSSGKAEQLTTPDKGEAHRYPAVLPDGRVVFTMVREGGRSQVAVLSPDTGKWDVLVTSGSAPRYVSTGHLLYADREALHAVPFDLSSGRVTGEAKSVESGVAVKPTGAADYDVSADGSLVFVASQALVRGSVLGWVSRDGTMTPVMDVQQTRVFFPRVSSSGTRVIYQRAPVDGDLWIRDLERSTDVRLTLEGTANLYAVWGPDEDSVTFASNRTGAFHLYTSKADLSRPAELMERSPLPRLSGNWSRGQLVFYEINDRTSRDIWTRRSTGEATPLIVTSFNERAPQLSPDGRWLAYVSDQSGSDQIYLTPFPTVGRVIPVSVAGGREPVWSPHGNELFYRNGNQMWSVTVGGGASDVGKSRLLFEQPYDLDANQVGHPNYDVSPDGTRFLMVRSAAGDVPSITLVQNWLQELRRLVPTN